MMTESDAEYPFIDLKRTFRELSDNTDWNDEFDLSHALHLNGHLSWPDLIENYRVIILSEAGSGKTTEIRNIASTLRSQKKPAFFIRLEHIPHDFEHGFEVGTFKEFESWLASTNEGWILLDSVDETRLQSPKNFNLAIRKLEAKLATAKDRSHIFITGRINAWRPKSDLRLCNTYLPFTPSIKTDKKENFQTSDRPSEKPQTTFKIVTLDNLSPEQIAVFSRERGVNDSKAFIDAIERADAWSFASRPQDLMELIEFWLDQRQIGSRLETMRNSISRRLQERDQERSDFYPLAPQKAREGARLIAAATILMRNPIIRVPDGAEPSKGIALQELLPDWDDKERSILLSRPIFDEAIYGTVRFHHRSVREYLAAEWFAELLGKETSRRKIESLFFTNQYGLNVIVPTLRPILPWLAILDSGIREKLLKFAPEVIFEGGDLSQLPLETRRDILHKVCVQLASKTSGHSVIDHAAVQHFANPDLTDDIRGLLKQYSNDTELQAFLLRMVWLGRISDALPEAKKIALLPSAAHYTRTAAFRAVQAIGSEQDKKDIRNNFLAEAAILDRQWLADLTEDTTPAPDTIKWLLECLKKTQKYERFGVDYLSDTVCGFVQNADLEQLPELLDGFNQLLNRPPLIEEGFCEISQTFIWLIIPASYASELLIKVHHPVSLQPTVLNVLNKLRTQRDYSRIQLDDAKASLLNLVPKWPELNRALFWYEIRLERERQSKKHNKRLTDFLPISFMVPFWRFGPEDFDYVSEQIETQPLQDDKLVALSLALNLYTQNDRPDLWREKLQHIVCSDTELSDQLEICLNPPLENEQIRLRRLQNEQLHRKNEERKQQKAKALADLKKYLSENLDKLRDPTLSKPSYIFNGLTDLYTWMYHNNGRLEQSSCSNWRSLEAEFGKDIAQAFRDGIVAYWRHERPTIRSEGAPENQIPGSVILGLSGLEIEAQETPDWAQSLSTADAELACRYASFELNGFPNWFPELFKAHTNIVTNFLLQEIRFELSQATPEEEDYYILNKVSWSSEWSWADLGPHIASLLRETGPANESMLGKLLRILQGSAVSDEEIAALSSQKVRSPSISQQHMARWYAVWVGVNPEVAIPALETCLEKLPPDETRTEFAMKFITNLWEDHREEESSIKTRTGYQTPQYLKTLYLLMQRYIRINEDINRANQGPYSPNLRDKAQEARDTLLNLLNGIPGKETFLALEEISYSHPDEESRSWFVRLAKARATQDADFASWTPTEICDFYERLERTPKNHQELAELAVMRLLDLKDDLENGDSSIAEILKKGAKCETDMRKYIGRALREKAFNRYSVPQEEELADAKKPDIRFHGMGFDAPLPVELKLADNWSGSQLFERLENQLCGDYLRDNRSTHGIFLLVHTGRKTHWEVPYGDQVNFEDLIAALQAHWEKITPKFPNIDKITVIGIDLLKRET